MAFRTEAITVLPAIVLFLLSSYLAFFTSQVVDSSAQKALLTVALGLFLGGLVLAVCWGYYWGIRKRFQEKER
jgi:membrane protease YdiL (CAAX protease family)